MKKCIIIGGMLALLFQAPAFADTVTIVNCSETVGYGGVTILQIDKLNGDSDVFEFPDGFRDDLGLKQVYDQLWELCWNAAWGSSSAWGSGSH
jgi:hypothetical protein